MKHFTIYLSAALLLLAGCRQYDEQRLAASIPGEKDFSATMESDSITRTSMENLHILWSATDSVSLFWASEENKLYKVKEGTSGSTSTTLSPLTWDNLEDDEFSAHTEYAAMSANVALYPASRTAICGESEATAGEFLVKFTLPGTQKYAASSFAEGAFPMVAVTTGKDDKVMHFKNICGIIKLPIKGNGQKVKSITIQGYSGEFLSGRAALTCSNETLPQLTMDEGGNGCVTLDCGDGITLNEETATDFYIALPPTTFANGLVIAIATDVRTYTKSTSSSLTISRSKIKTMGQINLDEVTGINDIEDIGIYDLSSLAPAAEGWASDGTLPYAMAHSSESDILEIYSFEGDSLISLSFPTVRSVNSEITIDKNLVTSSSSSSQSFTAKVVKIYRNKVWLKTTDGKLGFVLEVEE